MNTLHNDIEETNILTVEQSKWRNLYLSLERLRENKDFQAVILEGYFRDAAVDGVSMLAHDYTVTNGKRPEIMESLVAISRLQDFFRIVDHLGAPQDDSDEDEQGVTYE